MDGQKQIKRRDFLKTGAATGAFLYVPGSILGSSNRAAASDKLNIAGVGVGGRGFGILKTMASENIVALCDVDHNYAARAFKEFPAAKRYTDFRIMLEKQKDIDAVMIATPDHTHAVVASAAMKAGKHVYCEKPLTHDIYEARSLKQTARKAKVCTQMGIQGHSSESVRLICEWLWSGAIGEVREVDAWCSLTYYPAGHVWWSSKLLTRPDKGEAVPEKLNWDLWLGPASQRPFHSTYHPATWRAWWDFGNGMMGDRGAHSLDPVAWALKLGYPSRIDASSTGLNADTHPLSAIVTFHFPERENMPPLKLTWYEGLRPPRPTELEDGRILGNQEGGVLFKGSKGKLMCGVYGESPRLIPESRMQAFLRNRPEKSIPRVIGNHQQDWIRTCKAGGRTGADFSYSSLLTEICLLGNVAKRVDGPIEWDAAGMKVSNNSEANRFVRSEYRSGWTL